MRKKEEGETAGNANVLPRKKAIGHGDRAHKKGKAFRFYAGTPREREKIQGRKFPAG